VTTIRFTDRELDLMDVLWERGSSTAAEMQEALQDELAYTTVLTLLQTLEEKGYARAEKDGRAYRFHPEVDREEAGGSALRYVLDKIFRGSPEQMLYGMVDDVDLTRDELRRMRGMLDDRLGREAREGGEESR
jgi:predicted transcriptional regulator